MQDRDFQWFLDNYDKLFEKYGRSFLVIKNERVIGTYETFAEAVESTMKTEELGSFIVQECTGTQSAYTVNISSMNFMN